MKALTLTQPWATLVALGHKQIETRSWATGYRGPLAIHAAKGLAPVGGKRGLQALCATEPFCNFLTSEEVDTFPYGAVLAVCELVAVFRTDRPYGLELSETERAFGDYTPGRYAWLLRYVSPLSVPVPCKGALGLWKWVKP